MAYLQQDSEYLIDDLIKRKEYYWTKHWDHNTDNKFDKKVSDIIPRFMLDNLISKNSYLKLQGHQEFTTNFINPDTNNKRLHIKWSTGSGKSIGALAIAMRFIKNYKIESELGNVEIGSVFIIGFSERVFKAELLRYPEFGFINKEEKAKLSRLRRIAANGTNADLTKYKEYMIKIKRRFSNRKGNGFFKFYGYKAFVNRILVTNDNLNINNLSEEEILDHLKT